MPVGWFLVPLCQVQTAPKTTPIAAESKQLDQNNGGALNYQGSKATWTSDSSSFDLVNDVRTLDGHVHLTFDKDVLTADHLEAHMGPDDQYFVARSGVKVTDPYGTLQADQLRVTWKETYRYAHAENVTVHLGDVVVHAAQADLTEDQWILTRFTLTADSASHPAYILKGARMVVRPGHSAILQRTDLFLFGKRLFGFHRHVFNLDPRASGIRPPTPEIHSAGRLGYNWTVSQVVDPRTVLQLHDSAAQSELPSYGLLVNRSFTEIPKDTFPISPRSEFQLRFDFSYLDNVLVDLPSEEVKFFQRTRSSMSAESSFNAGVTGRGDAEAYTVPGSLEYEVGHKLGSGGYLSDFKVEDIDPYRENYIFRGEWLNSLELEPRKINDQLYNMSRIDSGVYQSKTNYFWVRGSESLIYHPAKRFTLAGSIFGSISSGTQDLDIDPLYYHNGASGRMDYQLGPRKASVLLIYDTERGLFDKQFIVTQALGGLEAFVSYRQYPGDFHLGITFRVDQFEDLLTRRSWRKNPKTTEIGIP